MIFYFLKIYGILRQVPRWDLWHGTCRGCLLGHVIAQPPITLVDGHVVVGSTIFLVIYDNGYGFKTIGHALYSSTDLHCWTGGALTANYALTACRKLPSTGPWFWVLFIEKILKSFKKLCKISWMLETGQTWPQISCWFLWKGSFYFDQS